MFSRGEDLNCGRVVRMSVIDIYKGIYAYACDMTVLRAALGAAAAAACCYGDIIIIYH